MLPGSRNEAIQLFQLEMPLSDTENLVTFTVWKINVLVFRGFIRETNLH